MASVSLFGASVSDPLWSSCNGVSGVPLKSLGRSRMGTRTRTRKSLSAAVVAKLKKVKKHDYPWPDEIDPNVKGGYLSYLSHFKPLKAKPKLVTLPFEKPLMDLEKKLIDVRKMADETGLDFRDQIISLESKYQEALKDLYIHLTPIQRLSIARHPNRPTFLDHVMNITDKWVELHGDRVGYDDPAIVTGIGSIDGRSYMCIGHQKGRNTKENIERNFGMPTPHGYRKALRMMYYADHHGLPIITFVDTPGAFADLKSEELGQGEAIAHNLRTMFGLKVPIVTVVIGEGGSGGALAIGCANKLLMLENAVFYVASPEACAAILWKSSKASPKAAEQLKITATELCKLKVADGVIPEPLGGAHVDPSWTSQQIKLAVVGSMSELLEMDTPKLLHHRMLKFRHLGGFIEGEPIDLSKKVNMKTKEEPLIQQEKPGTASDVDLEYEVEKLKQQVLKSKDDPPSQPSDLGLNETIEKLKDEVNQEFAEAVECMGLKDRLEMLRKEVTEARSLPDQILDRSLTEKIEKLKQEFKQGLSEYPNYESLNDKLDMLKELSKAQKISERNEKIMSLKHEINEGFKVVMNRPDLKEKIDKLKAEISDAGASRTSDLDDDLREKIFKVKKAVESELAKKFSSLHLNVELVASKREASIASDVIEHPLYSELKEKIDEINDEIEEGIENAVNSTDLKNKIVMLKLEVENAGKSADPEVKHKIESMIQQIRQSLSEAMSSPFLMEKYEKLKQEIARAKESSSGELEEGSGKYNGALNQDALKEGDPKLDISKGRD
ncbi:acetyl-coenzyme A carboxylase carboxyl transferase subunit alpha, chloroplastic [Phoenix dactylifera]|uniref:acetyl-CoA carboxytransferase n=1 Tax=Phoenix dactylifera TaxID=42345 RepID=A0A8B7CGP6_PHODC|nr:acetyl-coenzyme A carboxylase carboxyl transferase subunit alpha, chloroplastic [Phoenix dactylifera]